MPATGPPIDGLLHRLAECPSDFLLGPRAIDVTALVCDHFRALGAPIPSARDRRSLADFSQETLGLLPVMLWLLRDAWFLSRPQLAANTWKLFVSEPLAGLAHLVPPDVMINDPDRREELVRLILKELALVPDGETAVQAADRLTTLDSVERDRVIRKTRAAEARAREVREAMARKRAEEAAARYSRE